MTDSPVTDNCPSWISTRERMVVLIFFMTKSQFNNRNNYLKISDLLSLYGGLESRLYSLDREIYIFL